MNFNKLEAFLYFRFNHAHLMLRNYDNLEALLLGEGNWASIVAGVVQIIDRV